MTKQLELHDLRRMLVPLGTAPTVQLGLLDEGFVPLQMVTQCLDQLERKILGISAGIDYFSPLETLAIKLLFESRLMKGPLPPRKEKAA